MRRGGADPCRKAPITWTIDGDPKEQFVHNNAGLMGVARAGGSSYIDGVILRDRVVFHLSAEARFAQAALTLEDGLAAGAAM